MSSRRNAAQEKQRIAVRAALVPRSFLLVLLCALLLAALPSCGSSSESTTASAAPTHAQSADATGADFAQPAEITVPPANSDGIDISGIDEGWVCASAESASRLKFQVICGETTYNYDLPNDGTPTIYPVNMGDGNYTFRIMQNTEGKNYVEYDGVSAYVSLSNEFAPFLIPNQFCAYTENSNCVKKALEITANSPNVGDAVAQVCTYVAKNVSYDTEKAKRLATATGYIPSPDETLSTRRGICFDYASLASAMLRSIGIPTKLVTGYVGENQLYHAWIMVYIDGTWQTAAFSVSPNEWSRCDVTFASTGATQYVGTGEGYTDRYTY